MLVSTPYYQINQEVAEFHDLFSFAPVSKEWLSQNAENHGLRDQLQNLTTHYEWNNGVG